MVEYEPSYVDHFRHYRKNYGETINIILDLMAGTIAGITITILGHPFEYSLHNYKYSKSKNAVLGKKSYYGRIN